MNKSPNSICEVYQLLIEMICELLTRIFEKPTDDAFTLNNIGYVAELEGDQETAQFFYDRSRQSNGASATVGVATRQTAEGRKLVAVAADNDGLVGSKVTAERDALRRQQQGPVVLRRRDNSVVNDSIEPQ